MAVTVAHNMLAATYFILRDKLPCRALGADYLAKRKQTLVIRYHVRRLASLGFKVDIQPLPQAA